jgi:hypothetical protein
MRSQQPQPPTPSNEWSNYRDDSSRNNNQQNFQTLEADPKIQYNIEVSDRQGDNMTRGPGHTKRQLRGAAAAGGITGLVFFGPVVGAVAAGGAALAVTSKGGAGNVARASGEAMASVGDRLKKIDKKHHVVAKTSKGVVKGCQWVSKRLKPKDATTSRTQAQVF